MVTTTYQRLAELQVTLPEAGRRRRQLRERPEGSSTCGIAAAATWSADKPVGPPTWFELADIPSCAVARREGSGRSFQRRRQRNAPVGDPRDGGRRARRPHPITFATQSSRRTREVSQERRRLQWYEPRADAVACCCCWPDCSLLAAAPWAATASGVRAGSVERLPVPVLVVGNLIAGGSGKRPLRHRLCCAARLPSGRGLAATGVAASPPSRRRPDPAAAAATSRPARRRGPRAGVRGGRRASRRRALRSRRIRRRCRAVRRRPPAPAPDARREVLVFDDLRGFGNGLAATGRAALREPRPRACRRDRWCFTTPGRRSAAVTPRTTARLAVMHRSSRLVGGAATLRCGRLRRLRGEGLDAPPGIAAALLRHAAQAGWTPPSSMLPGSPSVHAGLAFPGRRDR